MQITDGATLDLVKKAQNGDSDSMGLLIKQYGWIARSKSRKYFLSDGTDDDLIQEGMIGIMKAIMDFDYSKNTNLGSFVTMCVTSQIMDAVRTSSRDKHKLLNKAMSLDDVTEESSPEELSPIDVYLLNENSDIFYEKLNSLFRPEPLTVLKYYLDGYSYQEISDLLNIPTKKIDNILWSVKKKIKANKELFLK